MLMHMEIPALLVGLFCAGALAASMSSGDAMAHAAASIAVRDGLVTALGLKLDPAEQRAIIRWTLVVVMVASYLVAVVYRGSLVTLLLSAYGAVVQFAPGVAATLLSRRVTGPGVLAGLAAGSLLTVLLILWPALRPWPVHAGLYGLAVNTLVLMLVSALSRRRDSPPDTAFLEIAGGRRPQL
jgi:SSS family solute:Na+ symporter